MRLPKSSPSTKQRTGVPEIDPAPRACSARAKDALKRRTTNRGPFYQPRENLSRFILRMAMGESLRCSNPPVLIPRERSLR